MTSDRWLAGLPSEPPGCRPYDRRRRLRIPPAVDGLPLVEAMRRLRPLLAAAAWRTSCQQGRVTLDGRAAGAEQAVAAGQMLEHVEPGVTEPAVRCEIRLIFEDRWLLAVDKPAPLPMHPSGRYNRNTLIWMLRRARAGETIRCGHRIDANTSGLVLLTRLRAAAARLQPMFARGEVDKTYLARVAGHPAADEFCCAAPIAGGDVPGALRRCEPGGQAAETRFRVLRRIGDGTSLLQVRPLTGRTHQIRVHLWHLSHPICGDPCYLPDGRRRAAPTLGVADPPMCLHAWKLQLRHPVEGRPLRLAADVPPWARIL